MTIWTIDEVNTLRENYQYKTKDELCLIFNKSYSSIKSKANSLRLTKTKLMYKNDNIKILLDDTPESFYWIGFFLADAHISDNKIDIRLGEKDNNHLLKLKSYVNSESSIRTKRISTNFATSNISMFSITHKEYIQLIKLKFNINSNKTKNPPKINQYKFSKENMLALLIGFIDGDGSINYSNKSKTRVSINIRTHEAWEENLLFFRSMLYSAFNHSNNYDNIISKLFRDKNNNVILTIGKLKVIKDLKKFALYNNLPVLCRKWNKIIL
jgi:hypothetical protein